MKLRARRNPDKRTRELGRRWKASGLYDDMAAYMTALDRSMDFKSGAMVLSGKQLPGEQADRQRFARASRAYATLALSPANRRRVGRIADKIEFMVNDANGNRRTRIEDLGDAARAIAGAATKPGSWEGWVSGGVPNAYKYPAATSALLAVRPPRSRTVHFNASVGPAHSATLGRVWPMLRPWSGSSDRNLWAKLTAWTREYDLDNVKIPVALAPAVCDTLLRKEYGPQPISHDADAVGWVGMWRRGSPRRNPDEDLRRLERQGAAGGVNAQARHLVGLVRQGKIRADHVQSLAALGDEIATLAVGKPASTEGLDRLVFTETALVREWGPVWAVIAATSFVEVLDPELEGGGGGGLERLALSGREWVGGRRRCNLREHSGPPINSCFWAHASEWANDLAAVDTPSWVRYCGLAGINYMLLVDSADSAVRGEPPRLYRGYAGTPDTFAYDLWPVWSHAANALSLKAPNTAYGFNYDRALRDRALRDRAIDNLKPWIMAGSPNVWNVSRQNPPEPKGPFRP